VDPQLEGNHTGSTIIAHKSSHEVPAFPYQPGTSILLEEIGDVLQSGQNTSKPISLSPTVNNYEQSACDLSGNEGHGKSQRTLGLDVQTSIGNPLLSPVENEAPFNWYELLANDALGNFEKYSFLSHESRWEFNPASLLQQPSTHFRSFSHGTESRPEVGSIAGDSEVGDSNKPLVAGSMEPWNSAERLKLDDRETSLFQYFLETIGPLLDLYDPAFHFTSHVPHLAIYNTGLMKSILAVAAIHRSLKTKDLSSPAVTSPSIYLTPDNHLATQYYYETLNYLSQAMPYQTYAQSSEILATAILLGTYEMFDGSNRNWERHLKGTFWILRTQDIDGESLGLRRAAWWAWLRQDIWAAFRDKRRTLTIWQPTRPLDNLTGSDLACRSLYLLSKAVEYSSDEVKESQDMAKRLDEGNLLLYALEEWKNILPRSFFPLPVPRNLNSLFETIQIHPPAYAAAMQTYSFAKITVILNMPSSGGINEYHERQKVIDVAVNSICGIARSPKGSEIPLAFVSAQCLFSGGFIRFNM